jgi:hypothetical protein
MQGISFFVGYGDSDNNKLLYLLSIGNHHFLMWNVPHSLYPLKGTCQENTPFPTRKSAFLLVRAHAPNEPS